MSDVNYVFYIYFHLFSDSRIIRDLFTILSYEFFPKQSYFKAKTQNQIHWSFMSEQ